VDEERYLGGLFPANMVEVQHAQIRFAAIDARVSPKVLEQRCSTSFSRSEPCSIHFGNFGSMTQPLTYGALEFLATRFRV
jgi:hypothetical protein